MCRRKKKTAGVLVTDWLVVCGWCRSNQGALWFRGGTGGLIFLGRRGQSGGEFPATCTPM